MPTQNQSDTDSRETDPWWAKYWYASAIALAIWMLVAIYGAVNYDLELKDAAVIVREAADGKTTGIKLCQLELWWLVIAIPLSLIIVNALLALLDRKKSQSA